jgi:hypothetical protein
MDDHSIRVGAGDGETNVVRVKASQKFFTEEEVSDLIGIQLDLLRDMARSHHLGFLGRAAEVAGEQAQKLLFSLSDLMVLTVLYPRYRN